MGTTMHALIARHTTLVDRTESDAVPRGWHALLDIMCRDMEEALLQHPSSTLEIHRVTEKFGALRVYVHAGDSDAAEAVLRDVAPLISAAEVRSSRTCQVCGAMGRRRVGGRVATLCDAHRRQPIQDEQDGLADLQNLHLSDTVMDATSGPVDAIDNGSETAPAIFNGDVQPELRPGNFRLYSLRAVANALGMPADLDADALVPLRTDTEHQERLAAILARGDQGTWRELATPNPACLADLEALDAAAPHMGEVTALVRRHVEAALAIGKHVQLPPIMLRGEPGVGKSWYLSRLGEALGLPVRIHPMSASNLGEGLQGAHPSWRNASPGLVARTLLQERVANPVVLVDEIDKAHAGSWNVDPYRPFYVLLEPTGAKAFKDEYLQFELDASAVSWVLAGNEIAPLPEPIRDRLTVIDVPPLSRAHLAAVVASIYAEANAANAGYFESDLDTDVLALLLGMTPRGIRKAVQDAMVRAASNGKRRLMVDDVVVRERDPAQRFGFHASSKR